MTRKCTVHTDYVGTWCKLGASLQELHGQTLKDRHQRDFHKPEERILIGKRYRRLFKILRDKICIPASLHRFI